MGSKSTLKNSQSNEDGAGKQHWLEAYPPNIKVIREKNQSTFVRPARKKQIQWKRVKIQDKLDIHGMTSKEAIENLHSFINSMRVNRYKFGLIIHGKGLNSDSKPVLKPLVSEFLKENLYIDKFVTADRKNGGEGSTLFLMKY